MTTAQIFVIIALIWMVVALISNRIPNAAIALSLPLLFIIGGVYEKPTEAFTQLTSPTFLLIASIMILVQGMFESGLAKKIGELLLKLTGGRKNETLILLLIIAISTLLTMFLPNGGTCSILIPVCIGVSMATGVSRSKTLFVMNMAVGLGGCMTVLGTSINQFCRGQIMENGFGDPTFFGFGAAAIPAFFIGIVFMLTIGRKLLPDWVDESQIAAAAPAVVENPTPEELKKQRWSMAWSGISFAIVVFGVLFEKTFGISAWVYGLVAVVILLLSKAISEKKAFAVPWGILMFVFACSVLADACSRTGIAQLAMGPIANILGDSPSPYLLTGMMFFVGGFFTQFMSNFGTFGIFAPMTIALAQGIGANPATMLIALAMGCNASYVTPMATASNMFIVADGEIKFMDWVKNGLPQWIILGVCCMIFLPIFYPFY